MKCGQPLCGSAQKRCREDILLLNQCLQSVGKGRILDVRTQQKAQHQTSKGTIQIRTGSGRGLTVGVACLKYFFYF